MASTKSNMLRAGYSESTEKHRTHLCTVTLITCVRVFFLWTQTHGTLYTTGQTCQSPQIVPLTSESISTCSDTLVAVLRD